MSYPTINECLFDADFYRNKYADVAHMSDHQAYQHYMCHGYLEGREYKLLTTAKVDCCSSCYSTSSCCSSCSYSKKTCYPYNKKSCCPKKYVNKCLPVSSCKTLDCNTVCDISYRRKVLDCDGCVVDKLNVKAPFCLLADTKYKVLFCKVKKDIVYFELESVIEEVVDDATYVAMLAKVVMMAGADHRIVIVLQDGTVMVDTAVPFAANTYANFVAKTIGENHNTRVSIMDAQSNCEGVGYETKLSTSTSQKERYVAVRLGQYLNSSGTFRISEAVV